MFSIYMKKIKQALFKLFIDLAQLSGQQLHIQVQVQEGFIKTCKQIQDMGQNSGNRKWSGDQQTTYTRQGRNQNKETRAGIKTKMTI